MPTTYTADDVRRIARALAEAIDAAINCCDSINPEQTEEAPFKDLHELVFAAEPSDLETLANKAEAIANSNP